MVIRQALFVLFVLVLSVGPAAAQSPVREVRVRVLDTLGDPIAGASVTPEVDAGRVAMAVLTGPDGVASVPATAGTLPTALRLSAGRAQKKREFEMVAGHEITVTMPRHHITVALDGERFRFRPPIRLRLRPDLLRVVMPKADGAERAA